MPNAGASGFVVTRLLRDEGMYRPRTYSIGPVDFRPGRLDTPAEKTALDEALKRTNEKANLDIAMRIVTVCDDETIPQAEEAAAERFDETLDVLDFTLAPGLSQWSLLEAGCTRDLRSGRVMPRGPKPGFQPVTVFAIQAEEFPAPDMAQALLITPRGDLKLRLVRSLHWSRRARWESSRQLRVLFRWFAMESIWKDGDEDIVPYLLWAVGYPNGTRARLADSKRIAALNTSPLYRPWKRQIAHRLARMRSFRNDSVHSGFRQQDISPADLASLEQLSALLCPRVQRCVFSALTEYRKTTRTELADFQPIYFNTSPNLVVDVTGIVLLSLAGH